MIAVNGSRELAVLDQATRILADVKSFDEIKTLRDKAEAARAYVKAARLGLDLQNRAAEIKLLAERKAGQFLSSLKLRGGDRKSKRHDASLTLADLGISRDQSKRWQHIASVPEGEFTDYIALMNEQSREITSAGLLRLAKQLRAAKTPNVESATSASCQSDRQLPAQELFNELANHFRLLDRVLQPACNDDASELKHSEKRLVKRLIREMNELIQELGKTIHE